jgi:hypothetical protein
MGRDAKEKDWDETFCLSIEHMKSFGVTLTKSSQVVRNWHQQFQKKQKFTVKCMTKHSFQTFLEQNKDAWTKLQQYGRAKLSVEVILNAYGVR